MELYNVKYKYLQQKILQSKVSATKFPTSFLIWHWIGGEQFATRLPDIEDRVGVSGDESRVVRHAVRQLPRSHGGQYLTPMESNNVSPLSVCFQFPGGNSTNP